LFARNEARTSSFDVLIVVICVFLLVVNIFIIYGRECPFSKDHRYPARDDPR
jgi:hypothetical protein